MPYKIVWDGTETRINECSQDYVDNFCQGEEDWEDWDDDDDDDDDDGGNRKQFFDTEEEAVMVVLKYLEETINECFIQIDSICDNPPEYELFKGQDSIPIERYILRRKKSV